MRRLIHSLAFLGALVSIMTNSGVVSAWPSKAEKTSIVVVLSAQIKPYLEALNGLREALGNDDIHLAVHVLDHAGTLASLEEDLHSTNHDLCVSIGPEATRFLSAAAVEIGCPLVYSMVLNPEKILGDPATPACGVSLSIPIFTQLTHIRKSLPKVRRVGILFNPDNNADFFRQASIQARFLGLEMVALTVTAQRQVPKVLQSHWQTVDALWFIPDQTVISKVLVEYVIKQALLHDKPTIGYNRFFSETGAAVAFVLDYKKVGWKTGELVKHLLRGMPCRETHPPFDVLLNPRVIKRTASERARK